MPSPPARNFVPRAPPRQTTRILLRVPRNATCTRSQYSALCHEEWCRAEPAGEASRRPQTNAAFRREGSFRSARHHYAVAVLSPRAKQLGVPPTTGTPTRFRVQVPRDDTCTVHEDGSLHSKPRQAHRVMLWNDAPPCWLIASGEPRSFTSFRMTPVPWRATQHDTRARPAD
jgi:hypothetical protein